MLGPDPANIMVNLIRDRDYISRDSDNKKNPVITVCQMMLFLEYRTVACSSEAKSLSAGLECDVDMPWPLNIAESNSTKLACGLDSFIDYSQSDTLLFTAHFKFKLHVKDPSAPHFPQHFPLA